MLYSVSLFTRSFCYKVKKILLAMKHLADRGKTVVCTLHQPSSQIIEMLDDLLVLSEGRVVYLGETNNVSAYLSTIGYPCPQSFNTFDHVLSVLSSPLKPANGKEHNVESVTGQSQAETLAEFFRHSPGYVDLKEAISYSMKPLMGNATTLRQKVEVGMEPASLWCQYKMSIWRQFIVSKRNKRTFAARIFGILMYTLIYSIVFTNTPYNQEGAMNFVGLIYHMTTAMAVWGNIDPYCASIPLEMPIYLREQQISLYTPGAFLISRTITEVPDIFVMSAFLVTVVYLTTNLVAGFGHLVIFIAIHTVTGWCAAGVGSLIGFGVENIAIANLTRRALGPVFACNAGIFINLTSIPAWLQWMKFISPTFYGTEMMMVNQWAGIDHLDCSDASKGACWENGMALLDFYGYSPDNFVRDIFGLIALTLGFRILSYIVLVLRTNRRKNDA